MNISKAFKISTFGKQDEIKEVFNRGRKIYSKFGLIVFFNKKQQSNLKAAILVKKNCGTAVQRNYIKRIIRHFIRDHAFVFSDYNRMIFLYRYKEKINYQLLKNELANALGKL